MTRLFRNVLTIAMLALGVPMSFSGSAQVPSMPALAAYGDLPAVEDAALSESGKRVAYVARIKGERAMVAVEDGKIIDMSQIGDSKIRSIEWVGENSVLLLRSDTIGLGPNWNVHKFEASSGILKSIGQEPELIFQKNGDVEEIIYGTPAIRKVDGKWKGYFGGFKLEKNANFQHIYRGGPPSFFEVDLESNRARQIAGTAGDNVGRRWLVGPDGKIAVTFDQSYSKGVWTIENGQGVEIRRGVDAEGDAGLVALGPDGNSVIYSQETADGAQHWFKQLLAGGEPEYYLADKSIDYPLVERTTGKLIGYRPQDWPPRYVFFDPAKQEVANKIGRAFKGLNATLADWTPDFRTVLVRTNGPGDSGTLWRVDMTTLKADAVGFERPTIYASQVGPVSVVTYKAKDGLEMDGVLTLPPGRAARNLPAVMLPHGGPSYQDDPVFDWWAQAFASRGYAVFQPNFRGSTNRDAAFRQAGYGQWGKLMQTDISDGLEELVRQGIVDPKRVCIMGGSYGGYAALAGVTLQQGLYRCAVSVAGVSDLKMRYDRIVAESVGSAASMNRRILQESMGDPKGFDDVSPRRFAGRADAPVLLIHGKDDTVVSFGQSSSMANALKAAGKPYELVVLKGEDHYLSRSETRKQMLESAMAFVQKYNPAQ